LPVLDQDFLTNSESEELVCIVLIVNLQVDPRGERLQSHCDLNLAVVTEHVLALVRHHLGT